MNVPATATGEAKPSQDQEQAFKLVKWNVERKQRKREERNKLIGPVRSHSHSIFFYLTRQLFFQRSYAFFDAF